MRQVPLTRDLVLVGGGHAHALVLRAWGMKPLAGARVTVINPGPTSPYTGMLPGHIAGHYARDDLEIDLVRLCRFAGARLILDRAVGIDRARGEVVLAGRGPVGYDVASVDVGITAAMALPGFAEFGTPAKPLDVYAARWRAFVADVEAGRVAPEVAIIGGGVAGCELAMAMSHRLRGIGAAPVVTVIEASAGVTGTGAAARARLRVAMADLGVEVRAGARVARVAPDHAALADGGRVPARLTVGAAGAFPHAWIAETDLPQQDGFIEVGRDFGVRGDKALFAVGDCAVMPEAPRPKAGVFAVRAAPVLHHNLRVALSGGARRMWRPQRDYLKLISLGGKVALAEKFGFAWAAPVLWQWKDRIDRAFMDRLSDLPAMKALPPPAQAARGVPAMMRGAPMCGGCGSKVGPEVLRGALAEVAAPGGALVAGAGDDAAVLRMGDAYQVISTDHLRAFTEDAYAMARIAAVHALGDVWAMGAAPQVALASIVLPRISPALQTRTLGEITAAFSEVLGAAGAQLAGGHTTMGAEMTLGLTVTGTRDAPPIMLGGGQAGDALVLTRPVGAGVILAADMQGRAAGGDVAALLAQMAVAQDVEAQVLGAQARAMTDVTGFGLAGHALAMARASGVRAVIDTTALPVYAGARALSDRGIASTLMPDNRAAVGIEGADPLLFDPQTAGGLLAAVPVVEAERLCAALAARGRRGWIIGRLEAGQPEIVLG